MSDDEVEGILSGEGMEEGGRRSQLYRTFLTLMEMCADRGFEVDEEDVDISYDDFTRMMETTTVGTGEFPYIIKRSFNGASNPSERIAVFITSSAKIGVKAVREMKELVIADKAAKCVLVTQTALTPSAKKAIQDINLANIHTQTFEMLELIVNITKHELVPKHQVLSNDEKTALLARYKIKEQQLPRIKVSDPVSRYYGLRRGQVVKITRPSPTAGRYVTYRMVF